MHAVRLPELRRGGREIGRRLSAEMQAAGAQTRHKEALSMPTRSRLRSPVYVRLVSRILFGLTVVSFLPIIRRFQRLTRLYKYTGSHGEHRSLHCRMGSPRGAGFGIPRYEATQDGRQVHPRYGHDWLRKEHFHFPVYKQGRIHRPWAILL